ncbi:tRNA glutamyl-Q(34) synthetase GluQRS [Dongia rigui]|uniref:tRNA glutamyl-Q(34) synthetase GluQRS n=1 Tax=Dongia rigui TaxID=940149 RepID=A0ABU5DZV6_9PROT|nr:tRNA glutamyl-Q(34) synthetase GluQRS [Dongia rigui]MDY0872805.1 tRNA glutamyl-Q(34) synthetase GluQRS [Dongia rigui]
MPPLVTRFAPSPTGYLHLGHAFSALDGWTRARAVGGRFLLRIEDIDQTRCRPEFEAALLEDLSWLGLDWDGEVRRQSDHFADYQAALDKLQTLGVIYPCFCSRKDIAAATSAPQGPDGPVYPGTCRHLDPALIAEKQAAGLPFVLRLDVAKARVLSGNLAFTDEHAGRISAQPEVLGDVVLARRDTPCSYHLCVTLDDALQGVTLVTRAEDLLPSTHVHRLLQALLALPVPAYAHHRLLADAAGQRLAKRAGAPSLRSMRDSGTSAAEVRTMIGYADPIFRA